MTRPFNKKHFWLIVGVVAFLEVLIICLVLQWKYLFPTREVSELYARYADVDGVEASFIKDYKVNDSVFVDVTVLEATDSVGWQELRTDFKLSGIQKETSKRMGKNISYKYAPKKDYTKGTDTTNILNNDCVAIKYTDSTLCIFHYNDEETRKAIVDLLFQHMYSKTSINTK